MSSGGDSPVPTRANGNGLLRDCTASQDAELEMSEVRLINEDETMPFNEHNLDSVLSNPDYARHRQALLKRCHGGRGQLQPASAAAPASGLKKDLPLLCLQGQRALHGVLDEEPPSPLQCCSTRYASMGCTPSIRLPHCCLPPVGPSAQDRCFLHIIGRLLLCMLACLAIASSCFHSSHLCCSPAMQAGLGCPWYWLSCWHCGTQRSSALAGLQPPATRRRTRCSGTPQGWRSTLLRVRPVSVPPDCRYSMRLHTGITQQLQDGLGGTCCWHWRLKLSWGLQQSAGRPMSPGAAPTWTLFGMQRAPPMQPHGTWVANST